MNFNPELCPSWQRACEYLVDSERSYVGRYDNGLPYVFLEEVGTLYPLRLIAPVISEQVDWCTDVGATRLALSILFDATWGDAELCERLYRRFAAQVIRGLPKRGWRLRRDFVWAWIRLTLS